MATFLLFRRCVARHRSTHRNDFGRAQFARQLGQEAAQRMGIKLDVTAQRWTSHVQERDREMLFQRLIDTIDQAIRFIEADSEQVLYVSPAFEQIWGRAAEELYDGLRVWRESIHPDDRERTVAEFQRWLEGKDLAHETEYRIVRPDGSIRWIHDCGAKIRDEQGTLVYVSAIAKDVTDEKRATVTLKSALLEITHLKERLQRENVYLQEEIKSTVGSDEIVGESHSLRVALSKVRQVAPTNTSVLLLGETGTGKELLARAVHNHSRRSARPLVKVNCASLPSTLIQSELFGHVKGAFTGAMSDRLGRFHLADKGTIFLDEIGELDLDLQSKLLRVLQEGEFDRIGAHETTEVDVRVVAATNRDLRSAVDEGAFRSDLYYRLAVFPIEIPPLRMRRSDIPLLVRSFVAQKRATLGKTIDEVPQEVMEALVEYDWPGNIRELENVIERAMILSPGKTLVLDELFDLPNSSGAVRPPSTKLGDVEHSHIVGVLEECNWTVKGPGQAAERLGLAPSTLRHRMKKLGIERPLKRPR